MCVTRNLEYRISFSWVSSAPEKRADANTDPLRENASLAQVLNSLVKRSEGKDELAGKEGCRDVRKRAATEGGEVRPLEQSSRSS